MSLSGVAPQWRMSLLARCRLRCHLRGVYGNWQAGTDLGEQVGHGHRVVAVWAGSPRTQALAPDSAIVASLLSEVTTVAFRTLIDDGSLGHTDGQPEGDFVNRSLSATKATLAAGVVAIGLTAVNRKRAPAGPADAVLVEGRAIVTQRVVPPLVGGGASSCPSTADGGRCERGGPRWRRPGWGHRPPAPDARPRPAIG